MASEEDNFDIDIYGDGEGEQPHEGAGENYKQDDEQDLTSDHPNVTSDNQADTEVENGHTNDHATNTNAPSKPQNTLDTSSNLQPHDPKQTPQQQGVKRKGSSDDRPVDPGATSALLISDLHWWSTEDDVRGWANQAGCEDELKDVTFSEHKVNGKSKGLELPAVLKIVADKPADKHSSSSRLLKQPPSRSIPLTRLRLQLQMPANTPLYTQTISRILSRPCPKMRRHEPKKSGRIGQPHRGRTTLHNSRAVTMQATKVFVVVEVATATEVDTTITEEPSIRIKVFRIPLALALTVPWLADFKVIWGAA